MLELEYEYIDIVFENCNIVRVMPENILFMGINGIFDQMIINMSGQFMWYKSCEYFEIILKAESLNTKTHFQKEHYSEDESFKNHLDTYKDITSIYIKRKEEDKEIHVVVPYETIDDKYDSPNVLMEVFYDDETYLNVNHFKIIIKENKQKLR